MEQRREKRLEKRRYLLSKYEHCDFWKTGGYNLYHKHYIIKEKDKLWQLTQSFTNDNEIWEYFYGETLYVVQKTKWLQFWLPKYKIIDKPFWDK